MKLYQVYFSPTGSTKKTIQKIGSTLSSLLDLELETIDFTCPETRKLSYSFEKDDIVLIGTPVYAGRVPNLLLDFLQNNLIGNGSNAVCVVSFGNRNFDEALTELQLISKRNGFKIISSGAFIGEHSFSRILAKNRPDASDLLCAEKLANLTYARLLDADFSEIAIDLDYVLKPYYRPSDSNGNFINILKVKPKTKSSCTNCGICAKVCPMGSISFENASEYTGVCIKCGACEKQCPISAKYYDDEGYLFHKTDLEHTFSARKEPILM